VTDPPQTLALSVAWEEDGEVTCINVWDSPEAIADFFIERVRPFVENEGPPANKPQRLGHAIRRTFGRAAEDARPLLDDGVLHRPQGGGGSGRDTDLAVDVLDVVICGFR
jgi:hypothetical protein